jgi:hypothetical protein
VLDNSGKVDETEIDCLNILLTTQRQNFFGSHGKIAPFEKCCDVRSTPTGFAYASCARADAYKLAQIPLAS